VSERDLAAPKRLLLSRCKAVSVPPRLLGKHSNKGASHHHPATMQTEGMPRINEVALLSSWIPDVPLGPRPTRNHHNSRPIPPQSLMTDLLRPRYSSRTSVFVLVNGLAVGSEAGVGDAWDGLALAVPPACARSASSDRAGHGPGGGAAIGTRSLCGR